METRINPMANEVGVKWAPYTISSNKTTTTPRSPRRCRNWKSLVGAWRETTVCTKAERAALELTEQGTRLADPSGVTDEEWANAAKHFDDDQLMALVSLICMINAFNRLKVITRTPGGEYHPGQFG